MESKSGAKRKSGYFVLRTIQSLGVLSAGPYGIRISYIPDNTKCGCLVCRTIRNPDILYTGKYKNRILSLLVNVKTGYLMDRTTQKPVILWTGQYVRETKYPGRKMCERLPILVTATFSYFCLEFCLFPGKSMSPYLSLPLTSFNIVIHT